MSEQSSAKVEPFIPIIEAADRLGIYRWKLRRAVKAGSIPSYRLHNSRLLVRLSEVIEHIEASQQGSSHHA